MKKFWKTIGLGICIFFSIPFIIYFPVYLSQNQMTDAWASLFCAILFLIPVIIWQVRKRKKKPAPPEIPPAETPSLPDSYEATINRLSAENTSLQNRINELEPLQARVQELEALLTPEVRDYEQLTASIRKQKRELELLDQEVKLKEDEYEQKENSLNRLLKRLESAQRKLYRVSNVQQACRNAAERYFATETFEHAVLYPVRDEEIEELLAPTVKLHLHTMDIRELRSRFKDNQKQIDAVLKRYEGRYLTKANRTIYQLMVIALQAELQNILYNLKYDKLDASVENVKAFTQKYFSLAAEGNQNIAPTLARFIGEIEFLFIQVVKIEYEYYVQRERIKEEQKSLREQMRQEAAERKLLEQQQRQVEKEESKYRQEMSSIAAQLAETPPDDSRTAELEKRLHELEAQLAAVGDKKEEIARLQHGKAGYVYIISNLGSFGDHIFKIGMTRRLDPQERVDELGSASVPFPFDVHSMIFSDDAPTLETSIHKRLNDRRVNKVNLRKEFFDISLDDLENLVYELQPTAEFKRTMLAEQYRQGLSAGAVYTSVSEDADEDEDIDA